MCVLCGSLGEGRHWSDVKPDDAGRGRERLIRYELSSAILDHYGLRLARLDGDAYAVTGKVPAAARAEHLTSLWALADRLGGVRCDPLDGELLQRLERIGADDD
jgi:hypothetical protein